MGALRLVPVSGPPIDVVKDPSVVGRDPGCEIVVADGSVSRRHARLERREHAWWVVDQGSANGTYLNSQRIAEQALKPGQELRFGALAYRVDLKEDPEATVSTPFRVDDSATVMAMPEPAPAKPAPPPPIPRPAGPPPLPPAPPSAAAAKERFKSASPASAAAPVPQMPAGPAPMKKGKSPFLWIGVGCCGCLLLVGLVVAAIFGGAYMSTKGAADAAHAWIVEVRQGQTQAAQAGMSDGYKSRADAEELERLSQAITHSKDATFWNRSVENDHAKLSGVLTGGDGPPQPIVVHLVKEGGAWKVDKVTLGGE